MSQTYDNTDSGEVLPPRDNHKMIMSRRVNKDGTDSNMIVTMSTLPDGKKIMDIYEKVGTLFPNDKGENANAPDYTGPIGHRRVAAWRKQKDNMSFMSLSLSDKKQGGNNAETRSQPVDDSIPF